MLPEVHNCSGGQLPTWRWGSYWGDDEGIEWSFGVERGISFHFHFEKGFLQGDAYAMRLCLFGFEVFVRSRSPWTPHPFLMLVHRDGKGWILAWQCPRAA